MHWIWGCEPSVGVEYMQYHDELMELGADDLKEIQAVLDRSIQTS